TVLDAAVVGDVAAHSAHLHARRLDCFQRDVPAHGFSRDVAAHVFDGQAFAHRVDVDVPLGVLQHYRSVHRPERHLAAPPPALDLAVHRLGSDGSLHAVHVNVGGDSVKIQAHPGGSRDLVLDHLRQSPLALGPHAHGRGSDLDVDAVATGVRRLHADGVLVPGFDYDLAAEVVDVEPHPGPDRHGRIGLLGYCQRDDGRDVQEHDV